MSIVKSKSKRKKGERYPRKRTQKALARKRVKTKKFKISGWKLNYPEYFKVIEYYPYIVRKDDQRYLND